jgi:hypothetical protein
MTLTRLYRPCAVVNDNPQQTRLTPKLAAIIVALGDRAAANDDRPKAPPPSYSTAMRQKLSGLVESGRIMRTP